MKLRDRLWLPDGAEEKLVRGNVKLELFDGRSGKKQEEVRSTNYITDLLTSAIQYTARGFLRSWVPTAGAGSVSNTDTAFQYGTPGFWLTSATSAENPSGDRLIRGGMTAYASTGSTYSGSSNYRGSLNVVESSVQPNKIIFVIDWATNAGNGTIGSVYATQLGFYSFYGSTTTAFFDAYFPSYGTTWTDSTTGLPGLPTNYSAYGLYMDPDGTHYWTMWSGYAAGQCTMVRRVIGTGVIDSTVSITGMTTNPSGFTNDGTSGVGNWWFNNTSQNIQKYPAAGATSPTNVYTGVLPTSQAYGAMCYGNGFLYIHRASPANIVDQYSATTGALVTTITLANEIEASWADTPNAGCFLTYWADSTNGDSLLLASGVPAYTGNTSNISIYSLAGAPRGLWRPSIGSPQPYLGFTTAGVPFWNGSGTSQQQTTSRGFVSRSLLPSAVTKSSTQTMKLTYEYDYT